MTIPGGRQVLGRYSNIICSERGVGRISTRISAGVARRIEAAKYRALVYQYRDLLQDDNTAASAA